MKLVVNGVLFLSVRPGGYLNEHGTLHLERFQLVLNELATFEMENFEQEYADSNWFKGKQHKQIEAMDKARARAKLGSWAQSSCIIIHFLQGAHRYIQP
jgi:5'-3' exonuclease